MKRELRHMARSGKTFFFSALWLPREVRESAAVAYSFCRVVDDLADESSADGRSQLEQVERALLEGDRAAPLTRGVLGLIDRYPSVQAPLLELVRACAADGPGIRIKTSADLLAYSKGVAGTVGRLMYPLLGGVDPQGERYAEALGVAMQCTNIARDVREDLAQGRVYVPAEWLNGVELTELASRDARVERQAAEAVTMLLAAAAEHYAFGLEGLSFLRADCRRGIEIAARCYAEIGGLVVQQGRLIPGRAVVPLRRKLLVAWRVFALPSSRSGAEAPALK